MQLYNVFHNGLVQNILRIFYAYIPIWLRQKQRGRPVPYPYVQFHWALGPRFLCLKLTKIGQVDRNWSPVPHWLRLAYIIAYSVQMVTFSVVKLS